LAAGDAGAAAIIQGWSFMAFEAIKAQISLLLDQMEHQPEDKHELYLQLHEQLNAWRATGQPLPEDLVKLERAIEAEMASDLRKSK